MLIKLLAHQYEYNIILYTCTADLIVITNWYNF